MAPPVRPSDVVSSSLLSPVVRGDTHFLLRPVVGDESGHFLFLHSPVAELPSLYTRSPVAKPLLHTQSGSGVSSYLSPGGEFFHAALE